MAADPFRALGLPRDPGLSDDDIRAAWHRVAATTHPDRADGGDPAAFAAAAAAYTDLRTRFGRTEALADLADRRWPRHPDWRAAIRALPGRLPFRARRTPRRPSGRTRPARNRPARNRPAWTWPTRTWPARTWPARTWPARTWAARMRAGRPARLLLLLAAAAAVGVLAVTADGWQPPALALVAGALTWLLRGGRRYLGARPPARPASGAAPDDPASAPTSPDGAAGPG